MFQPRIKVQQSPNMLPLASGENDSSVFLASEVNVRGKGLGLGQQSIKPIQSSRENAISKKPALGDVNKSAKDVRIKPSGMKPDGANISSENAACKTSKLKSKDDMDGLKVEIGRDVNMRNRTLSLSPANNDHAMMGSVLVEPIIQQYFEMHGDYPDIETIPTSASYNDVYEYDNELWYYSQPREVFNRSFEQMNDEEVDIEPPCPYIWSAGSESPMSEASSADLELELKHISFNSTFELKESWEPKLSPYVPNAHPFFG